MPVIVFAGPMKLAQRALQILNLALVVDLLALGEFQRFQDFFHLLERMFQFLNDAIDLINRLGNCRLLVLLGGLRMMASLRMLNAFAAFGPFGAFGPLGSFRLFLMLGRLNPLAVFSMFPMFLLLPVRVRHRFRGGIRGCIRVFGLRGRGRIAGRGQGTTISAAAGMASAAAPGSTPAARCGRIRLLGCALVCFVRRHKHRLPRGS